MLKNKAIEEDNFDQAHVLKEKIKKIRDDLGRQNDF